MPPGPFFVEGAAMSGGPGARPWHEPLRTIGVVREAAAQLSRFVEDVYEAS